MKGIISIREFQINAPGHPLTNNNALIMIWILASSSCEDLLVSENCIIITTFFRLG